MAPDLAHESTRGACACTRSSATPASSHARAVRLGVLYGIGAYGLWGVFPVYFKAVHAVPPLEIVGHRIVWSLALLAGLVLLKRGWPAVHTAIRTPRTLRVLALTTLLIAGNWLVFVWAVVNNQILQASLGYFINPLVNVLLGCVFLRERLRLWQWVSVLFAALGVLCLTTVGRQSPLLALFLAGTFGTYGLLRKVAPVDALVGLTVETALLTPIAAGYLVWLKVQGASAFVSGDLRMDLLLILAGVITAMPLLWFTEAARRLRLTTMGFLQYLAPTGHFLLAVLVYGEPLTAARLCAFVFIWAALALYSTEALRAGAARPVPAAPE
ncbi:MAG: EamA family transporter RarD [Planctomycetota bacterium]